MQIAVLCKENAFSYIYNSPLFASKQTFARIDYLRQGWRLVKRRGTFYVRFYAESYTKNDCLVCARIVNGTESTYAYDRQRERLQGMLPTANGDSIMQTQYKYDPVDNILGISNVITPKAPKKPKGLGGSCRTVGMDAPTAYPAPILSVTRQRFTKHSFIGDRRIASKISVRAYSKTLTGMAQTSSRAGRKTTRCV